MYILHYLCIFYIHQKSRKKKVFWEKNLHRKSFKFKDFNDMYILHNQGIFYILNVYFTFEIQTSSFVYNAIALKQSFLYFFDTILFVFYLFVLF